MVVTERLEHVDRLGSFINNLCGGKDTYKLQRRDRILGTPAAVRSRAASPALRALTPLCSSCRYAET